MCFQTQRHTGSSKSWGMPSVSHAGGATATPDRPLNDISLPAAQSPAQVKDRQVQKAARTTSPERRVQPPQAALGEDRKTNVQNCLTGAQMVEGDYSGKQLRGQRQTWQREVIQSAYEALGEEPPKTRDFKNRGQNTIIAHLKEQLTTLFGSSQAYQGWLPRFMSK